MNNKFFTKLIIIGITLLMIFSVVGQFFVSAETNEDDAVNKDYDYSEEAQNNEEIFSEDEITKEKELIDDQKDETEKEIVNINDDKLIEDKNDIEDETKEEEISKEEISEEFDVDTVLEDDENHYEIDDYPQVKPYTVVDLPEESENILFSSKKTLHNPIVETDNFQIVTITKEGRIIEKSTSKDFKTAVSTMKKDKNGAIRHKKSHSPMKFIAATRAILQSVPHRIKGNDTMLIDGLGTGTYVSRAYEMAYFETVDYNVSKGTGTVSLGINGHKGTAEMKQLDIIPMAYVENVIPVEISGSKEISSSSPLAPSTINVAPAQSYYKITQLSNGKKQVSYYSENLNRPKSSTTKYYKFSGVLGVSDEKWMKDGGIYYSWDGINFYTDRGYKDFAGTYYNYYQYLPLRTKSNLSATDLNNYFNKLGKGNTKMKNEGSSFVDNGKTYGMNPLLVYAMAAHESAWGASDIAKTKNNLFGWNAYDSDPSSASGYGSISNGIKLQMAINLRGYLDVTIPDGTYSKDSRYYGAHVGNRGAGLNRKYASDPFWGMKIASIAYQIDASTGLKDYKKIKLGVVNDGNEFVVKNTNVTKTNEKDKPSKKDAFYSFKSKDNYMGVVTTTIEKGNNDFYKTQSFASIDSNSNIHNIYTGKEINVYDWNKSVGYVKQNKIDLIHPNVKIPNSKPNKNILIGDVNGDNIVDTRDLILLSKHIAKLSSIKSVNLPAAYINDDEVIDTRDLIKLSKKIAGLE